MDVTAAGGFLRFFTDLPDPRGVNKIHKLSDLIVIAVMAVICGADSWAQVAQFGGCKQKWLATFLELPGGIPSHDTFGRVFSQLNPDAFESCFLAWMSALVELAGGRLVAIDGKSIRRSFEHGWDKSGMAHLVSALVSQGGNRVVFGQVAVTDKSNEITAIPRLLELMDLQGAVVTIDAIGTQREIVKQIIDGQGDYVLPVKQNQPALHEKVKAMMDETVLGPVDGLNVGFFEQRDEDHGRIELRRTWVVNDTSSLGKPLLDLWPGLAGGSLARVERTRQDLGDLTGKTTVEHHYYISSLRGCDDDAARMLGGYVRGHWAVENNLHWQLDVNFNEDDRRIRKGHGAENFSRLSRLALNLLKRDKKIKIGIKGKRLCAGWDHDYLLKLITA
ncbi:MAG: ISAs1 family transposase [Opitutaceae bacterium]